MYHSQALLTSLDPAVIGEIAYRCVFYAFCLNMAGGELKTVAQKFAGWRMMIIPHILPHMLFSTEDGVVSG